MENLLMKHTYELTRKMLKMQILLVSSVPNLCTIESTGLKKRQLTLQYQKQEQLIKQVQTSNFIRKVTFHHDRYSTMNYLDTMINDITKFCVNGDSVLNVDTTFELVEGLWLTDTCYENKSLLDKNNNHPFFPGPSRWHFRKDREEYRNFASDIISKAPDLIKIKSIGHDLDKATALGFHDIFIGSKALWCTQHIQCAIKE